MRFCSKCGREKFKIYHKKIMWVSLAFFQVFGKWICSDCFLRSGGGKKRFLRQVKSKLRKRIPPKTIEGTRVMFDSFERRGKIKLRKRWVREDLNRVFECYRVLKPLGSLDLRYIGVARKPKKGQMIWREIVFKKELEK